MSFRCCATGVDDTIVYNDLQPNSTPTLDSEKKETTRGTMQNSDQDKDSAYTYHRFSVESSSSISSFTLLPRLRAVARNARKTREPSLDISPAKSRKESSSSFSHTPEQSEESVQSKEPVLQKESVRKKRRVYETEKYTTNGGWCMPGSDSFLVRTREYLQRRKQKFKKPCAHPPVCQAVGVECFTFESGDVVENVPSRQDALIHKFDPEDNFIICNMVLTGPKLCVSFYFKRPPNDEIPPSWLDLWDRFENGTDEFRNSRLKMYPLIQQGPFALRSIAGKKPVLIGQKIPLTYFKGSNFYEINLMCDKDNKLAKTAVKMSYGIATKLVVDLAFIIQAETVEDLPEMVLGCCRCEKLDLSSAPWHL